jgi:dihydrofolate reductase
MIRFIAALDNKRGIADDNGIPWQGKIPSDVAYFREKTIGGSIMMGSGWYAEQKLPLPNRKNLVATKDPRPLRDGFEKVLDARSFLQTTTDDVWVGGGAGLFASTLDLADELYLTLIDTDFNCTKFFPGYQNHFVRIDSNQPLTENGITYTFTVWHRRK